MYVKKISEKKTGRVFLTIAQGYREPGTGKVKQKTVRSLGYLDELEKEFEDPIGYYKEVAKQMTRKANEAKRPLVFSFLANDTIDASSTLRKNLGFSVLSFFYHKLKIDEFFINRNRNLDISYSLNNIFQMLLYLKILDPYSKKRSFEKMDDFFLNFDFKITDIYGALDYFNFYKDDLLLHIHEMVRSVYGRDMGTIYYNVTNCYFEKDESDDLRKNGPSKENCLNPVMQIGLLMDNRGLPITYKLFEDNTDDCKTLMPTLDDLKEDFGLNRIIVVADKGMNTAENIAYNILHKNGYIYAQTVQSAKSDLKKFVLSDKGYVTLESGFKIKSRIVPAYFWVRNESGKRVKVPIEQKQVVFYSPDHAKRARYEREMIIEKARRFIKKNKSREHHLKSSFKYIAFIPFDSENGEIYDHMDCYLIDEDRIQKDMKFDGYCAIVTSELDMPDNKILDIYRDLWKIEDFFKIVKSRFRARPVYVSAEEHIQAHLLIYFVSLLLLRLLEINTGHKYPTKILIDEMRNITGTYLDENYYMFDHFNEIVKDLGDVVGVDFSKRFMTQGEIKNILAKVKK